MATPRIMAWGTSRNTSPASVNPEVSYSDHLGKNSLDKTRIVALSFEVEEGRVKRTVRYGSLPEALAASGLTLLDEVTSTAG